MNEKARAIAALRGATGVLDGMQWLPLATADLARHRAQATGVQRRPDDRP